MNPPNNSQTAGTPAPAVGKVPVITLPEVNPQVVAEPAAPVATGQVAPLTAIPLPLPKDSSAASNQTAAVINQTSTLQVADDKDVIEPEWVHKAKAIVNSTIDDPYKQSEDLTVLKADYMQKRYNKIVKLK